MKLAMSNLAFGGRFDPLIAVSLKKAGLSGVELAPTAIWGTEKQPTSKQIRQERRRWADEGLQVPSIQSLLYGRSDLALFDRETWPALRHRLMQMAEIADLLDAGVMVFGSPRNRVRGDLGVESATSMAAEFFSSLVEPLEHVDVILTLEPNPETYGADFMTTYQEVLTVVDEIKSLHIQPQIDTGCLHLSGEDPAMNVRQRVPAHVHISAPGLGSLPDGDIDHEAFSERIRANGYRRWATVEMLHSNLAIGDLERAANWAVDVYGKD